MLIPRSIASIAKCASKEAGRYNFNGILLERRADGTPIAVATDGRRLMSVTWPETTAGEYPAVADLSQDHVENFRTIMPAGALGDISKAAKLGKRNPKPALNNVLLCEPSANGHLKIGATNFEQSPVTTVSSIEGSFPPYADVIPSHTYGFKTKDRELLEVGEATDIQHNIYEHIERLPDDENGIKQFAGHTVEGLPFTAVRIAVNSQYLAELITALTAAVNDDANQNSVTLEIPLLANRPIKVSAKGASGIVSAIVQASIGKTS